jgi:hypothetical protein
MRNALLCCGAVIVGLLAYRIGSRAVRESEETLGPTGVRATPRLELAARSNIEGLVEDELGRVLGDAVVTLTPIGEPMGRREILTVSDRSGWWGAMDVRGRYVLAVYRLDYLPHTEEVELLTAERRVTQLHRGGKTVKGVVVDATGAPIDEARITFRDRHQTVAVAQSHRDGRFAVTLAKSYTSLVASAEGYVAKERQHEEGELVLRLVSGFEVHGLVARGDGTPCRDAHVYFSVDLTQMSHERVSVRTDPLGRFTAVVPPGQAAITAGGPGCAAATPLLVTLDGPREIRLSAERGFRLSGSVVTRGDRAAIDDARISIGTYEMPYLEEVTTDASGRFVVEGLVAGKVAISASHPEHMLEVEKEIEIAADLDVELELDRGRTLRGRIDPPAEATLRFNVDATSGDELTRRRAQEVMATSLPDGSFVLHAVPDGKHTLVAQTADGRLGNLTLEVARDHDDLRLRLDPAGTATLIGRLVDQAGAPLAAYEVNVAFDHLLDARTQITDADGRFRFEQLSAGEPAVYVGRLTRIDDENIVLGSGITSVTLIARRDDATVRGQVVDASGPVAGVWVTARPSEPRGSSVPTALTRDDGSFELTGMPHELHDLSIESQGGSVTGGLMRVAPNSTVTIRATRRPELVVVVQRGGEPVRAFGIHCSSEAGGGMSTHVRSVDGTYRLYLPTPATCHVESEGAGAFGTTISGRLELTLVSLTIATGQAPADTFVIYRHGTSPPRDELDMFRVYTSGTRPKPDGSFELAIFPGAGMITIHDHEMKLLTSYPVTGTTGGRIELR